MDLTSQLRASLLAQSLPPPSSTFLTTLISTRTPPPPLPSLLATAKARLLASDLTSSTTVLDRTLLMALPPVVVAEAAAASVKLTRDTHVQVLDVEDLSLSRWDQVEVLREVTRGERTMGRRIVRVQDDDDGGGGGEVDASVEAPARPAATHRLVLQDCRGTRVYAVELRRIPRLGVGSTAMGEKMLLRAGTVVARGIVLLTPETCLLLGGRVDAWHDAWANSRLRRLEEAAAGPRQQ